MLLDVRTTHVMVIFNKIFKLILNIGIFKKRLEDNMVSTNH